MQAKKIARVFKAVSNTSFAKKNTEDPEELNVVAMAAHNGEMRLSSTNSRIQVWCSIPGVEGEFAFIADNTNLASSIEAAANNNKEISFVPGDNGLMIVGSATFPVPAGAQKQTRFTALEGTPCASVLASDLWRAIKAALLSAKKGNDVMKNVKFSFDAEKTQFQLVSFNGTMMSIANVPLEDMDEDNIVPHVLVDAEILNAIMYLLEYAQDEILNITIEGSKMMLSSDRVKIVFSCSSDSFIDCEKLLKNDFSSYITFNVKSLKKQVNAIYKMVKDDIQCASNGTIAAFKNGEFKMDAEFEKANQVYFDIHVSALKNTLGCINGESVTISVFDKALVKIASEDADDVVFVVGCVKR